MSEQRNVSTLQEEELNFQAHISLNSVGYYVEIPANGEGHPIIHYNGDITFDGIGIHNRALSEDEISDAFSIFGNYADRVLSKEELEIIHKFLSNHPEIKSWQIKNNILYLEIEEDEDS